jgi:GT2 family glycosyltransferase
VQFGIPAERLVRCQQGIALPPFVPRRPRPLAPLHLAFAGGFQPTKGLHVLLDAVDRQPAGSIVLDVLGSAGGYHGDDGYVESMQRRLGHPAIRRLGPVPHDRMPAVLADVDVLVVPSVWIENAPFIIREAFACGVPVVASDLGGMAEMVRHEIDGLLFAPGDASSLATQIGRLTAEPGLLDGLRSRIVRPMSIEEDAARLRDTYARVCFARSAAHLRAANAERCGRSRPERVAAVVLNYRTPQQTCLAVRSLQTSHRAPDEILIVDNGSGDGSADALRTALPSVRVIASARNVGFSAGCNTGIRAALESGADHVLLVNSDAVLAPAAIAQLVAALNADSSIGIAGPVLLSREEPDQIASAGIAFSTRSGRMRHRGAGRRLASLAPGRVHFVDAVSGCVMLISRGAIERADLLDEEYFFSFEDVEFCLRVRDAGLRTACVQEAIAYHEGGRTIGRRSARRVYFATRNHLRLAMQTGSAAGRPLRAGLVIGLNAAYVVVSPEAPLLRGVAALVRGAWHHFSGRYGPD